MGMHSVYASEQTEQTEQTEQIEQTEQSQISPLGVGSGTVIRSWSSTKVCDQSIDCRPYSWEDKPTWTWDYFEEVRFQDGSTQINKYPNQKGGCC